MTLNEKDAQAAPCRAWVTWLHATAAEGSVKVQEYQKCSQFGGTFRQKGFFFFFLTKYRKIERIVRIHKLVFILCVYVQQKKKQS